MPKLVSNAEYERLQRVQAINVRTHEAYRWLAEWDEFLRPMWEFIFGNEKHWLDGEGNRFGVMTEGDISQAREKMRRHWAERARSEGNKDG